MQQKGKYICVWLYDEAARLLLNLPKRAADQKDSRWVVFGLVEDDAPIGLWISIDKIEERTPEGEHISKTWTVTPRSCLIRWEFITYAQVLGEAMDTKIIGFRSEKQ
jgi:hypothetical protein